jgi:hypothetical protein
MLEITNTINTGWIENIDTKTLDILSIIYTSEEIGKPLTIFQISDCTQPFYTSFEVAYILRHLKDNGVIIESWESTKNSYPNGCCFRINEDFRYNITNLINNFKCN